MQLTAIGLNHQTAPLSIREWLAFAAAALSEALRAGRQPHGQRSRDFIHLQPHRALLA
ncbi:hypothetical protein [Eikenella sp. NML99-0057]|uniref:hypothetical protein n=1 Tax=Eikenella sp. NML99-0057 TaxID=1795834 RepID=UPI0035171776